MTTTTGTYGGAVIEYDLLSMKGSIESAIIRLTRDNEGRTVRVAEWLSERQLRLETI